MKKSVELTAVNLELEDEMSRPAPQVSAGEQLDDLERPVAEAPPAVTEVGEPESLYFPVTIYEDDIREFYPRKKGKTGTRIVYKNGAARPVKETYAEVKDKFAALNN